ncbi:MAG: hypothetical protein ACYDHF_00805 [Candidatus Cryosericum sp.]
MEDDVFPRTEDDTPVTALERRAIRRRRISMGIKIWLICAFLVCTPLLYAYANFRAVKGESFFRAINTEPELLYARTHDTRFYNTWGVDTWEELTRRVDGAPKDISARMIFWWGSHADAVPDVPGRPERLVAVVTRGKATLRIFIEDYPQQSEEDFNRDYPGLVDGIVRRFTDQGALSWKESTTAQLRWLPSLVGYYVGLIGIDYALVYLQMVVRFLVILPGFLPLFLLVLSPSWLALPVFWLYTVPNVLILLYNVLPPRAWGWMKAAVVRFRHRA